MAKLFWICLGGALGTGARYWLSGWMLARTGSAFPYGTLAVNMLGSLALGFLMHAGMTTQLLGPTMRVALTTGVMGGFTTYSTFNYETLEYLREGAWLLGAANIAITVAACLLAGVAGLAAARWIFGN